MKKGKPAFWAVKVVCGAAVCIGFSMSVAAGPPAKNVPVNSIVLDYAADIAPSSEHPERRTGDLCPRIEPGFPDSSDRRLGARCPKSEERHAEDLRGFQPADPRQRPGRRESDQPAVGHLQVPRNFQVQLVRQQPPRLLGGRHEDVPAGRWHRLRRDDVEDCDGSVYGRERAVPGDRTTPRSRASIRRAARRPVRSGSSRRAAPTSRRTIP